jgi:hypothetical protein
MILGLPWESWLLILLAVGAGPAIELVFLRNQRRRRSEGPPRPHRSEAPGEPGT